METPAELTRQLSELKKNLDTKMKELQAKITEINAIMKPKFQQEVSINHKKAVIVLTERSVVTIAFTDSDDAEQFYESQVNFYK